MRALRNTLSSSLPDWVRKRLFMIANRVKSDAVHLFLLSPPLSGSTAIAQLVRSSPKATCFPGNGEGQYLPEIKGMLMDDMRWDPELPIDWQKVVRIFNAYWSPFKTVRFEKSPPHIVRAEHLAHAFPNARFLLTIRNPYAQIEGIVRRGWTLNTFGPQTTQGITATPRTAAEFWVKCAQYQVANLERLSNRFFFSYEGFTDNVEGWIAEVLEFVPELESIKGDIEIRAHNVTGHDILGVRNLNEKKITSFSRSDIDAINSVLADHRDLLYRFEYDCR